MLELIWVHRPVSPAQVPHSVHSVCILTTRTLWHHVQLDVGPITSLSVSSSSRSSAEKQLCVACARSCVQPSEQELEAAKEELVNEIVEKVLEVGAALVCSSTLNPRCEGWSSCCQLALQ